MPENASGGSSSSSSLLIRSKNPRRCQAENPLKLLSEFAGPALLTHHLGYEKGDPAGRGSGNSRNGTSSKALLTDDGEIEIEVPRDRAGTFEPVIVAKGQTRFDGFDEKIISLYGRGMTVREIQGHLAELYGTEVSPDLISKVTDAILDEVREWQSRPLEAIYPVVFFDALRVKIRDEGMVKNKAVYVVLGITASGEKDVLGLWIEQTEGAKFWLKVMNDLRNRGVADILIAVVDGLKGFPEAINSVFPKAMVQTCIVHLIRNSLSFVSGKDRKAILPSIKAIYHAENADAALLRLEDFEAEWGKRYPAIGAAWRRAWEHVIPFFAFAPEIRKMIYTTNAVEALNRSLRKIIKTRGSFPNDEAAMKLLYLAIRNAGIHWRRPVAWTAAMGQFAIQFGERFAGSAD
ncbi:IS256 family transposase [Bradyrhizobium sp. USDA 241]|uniref:IS256 family transposase n=1 Tax=Bradyrhizobium sp. USDA 241 TaxID=3377725 RepID=UPI003C7915AC